MSGIELRSNGKGKNNDVRIKVAGLRLFGGRGEK